MRKSAVQLFKVGDRIHAKIPYDDGAGPAEAKTVLGARWHKVDKVWTYPLSMEACRGLRTTFGKRLQIHEDLADWARKAVEAEKAQIELRSASDATIDRTHYYAPKLAKAMADRTYQRVAARFIADGRTVLIADEPGLGKTLEALSGMIEAGARKVIVFAKKKAAETVWGAEVPRWLGDLGQVFIATGDLPKAKRDAVIADFMKAAAWEDFEQETGVYKMRVLVCNIEMCRIKKGLNEEGKRDKRLDEVKFPQLFAGEWDAIVVDESHKALIGKNVMSNNITLTRYGFMQLPLRRGGLKVALSGTPTRGKNQNMWGTLNWLRPDLFTSYWRWVETYFKVTENAHGGREIGELVKTAEYDRMLAPYTLRRTKGEVAADMPPRQYGGTPLDPADPNSPIGVWLDMEPAQKRHYRAVKEEAVIALESGELYVNGHLAEMTRMKQFATCDWEISGTRTKYYQDLGGLQRAKGLRGEPKRKGIALDGGPEMVPVKPSNKYNWLLEFVEERAAAGLKVVVSTQFTKVANALSAWLLDDGVKSYLLTGETRDRAVAATVAAFNDPEDDVPVCILNTMAGGESINLDACADDVVFMDETYIPDDQEQVENRIHRMSRIHQVNVWYLRSRGTIDEDICRITGAREGAVKARLDGSRGIEVARKIMER